MSRVTLLIDVGHQPINRVSNYLCVMFSKTFGHALRATTYVAVHGIDGKKIALQSMSSQLEMPHAFLGKIMQSLVRHGIIDSFKGPNGGFSANRSTLQTPLVNILKITDGNLVFEKCALGLNHCNDDRPCLLHQDFAQCRNGLLQALAIKTIQDLADQIDLGLVFLF